METYFFSLANMPCEKANSAFYNFDQNTPVINNPIIIGLFYQLFNL